MKGIDLSRVLSIGSSFLCIVGGVLVIVLAVPEYDVFSSSYPLGYSLFWFGTILPFTVIIGVLMMVGGLLRQKYHVRGYILCVIMGFASIPFFRYGHLYGTIVTFIGGFSGVFGYFYSSWQSR